MSSTADRCAELLGKAEKARGGIVTGKLVDPHLLLGKVKVKSLSHVRLFATPWTVAYQAPPSMGFSRQENWGVPMFRLVLEQAEEPEIKLPISAGSSKKQESSRKTFLLY